MTIPAVVPTLRERIRQVCSDVGIEGSPRLLRSGATSSVFSVGNIVVRFTRSNPFGDAVDLPLQLQLARRWADACITPVTSLASPIETLDGAITFWDRAMPVRPTTWRDVGRATRLFHDVTGDSCFELSSQPPFRSRTMRHLHLYLESQRRNPALATTLDDFRLEIEAGMRQDFWTQSRLGSGVIHRDLTRANVIVTWQGPRCIDLDDVAIGARERDLSTPLVGATSLQSAFRRQSWHEISTGYGVDTRNWPGHDVMRNTLLFRHMAYLAFRSIEDPQFEEQLRQCTDLLCNSKQTHFLLDATPALKSHSIAMSPAGPITLD